MSIFWKDVPLIAILYTYKLNGGGVNKIGEQMTAIEVEYKDKSGKTTKRMEYLHISQPNKEADIRQSYRFFSPDKVWKGTLKGSAGKKEMKVELPEAELPAGMEIGWMTLKNGMKRPYVGKKLTDAQKAARKKEREAKREARKERRARIRANRSKTNLELPKNKKVVVLTAEIKKLKETQKKEIQALRDRRTTAIKARDAWRKGEEVAEEATSATKTAKK